MGNNPLGRQLNIFHVTFQMFHDNIFGHLNGALLPKMVTTEV